MKIIDHWIIILDIYNVLKMIVHKCIINLEPLIILQNFYVMVL